LQNGKIDEETESMTTNKPIRKPLRFKDLKGQYKVTGLVDALTDMLFVVVDILVFLINFQLYFVCDKS
jgi:hypothetical protein